jgi:predicted transcriptional regulator
MHRQGEKWTNDELVCLERALSEGATLDEAAQELGRTRKGVQHRAHSQGLMLYPGRRPDVAKRAVVAACMGDGTSTVSQVAASIGLNPRTVRQMVVALVDCGSLRRIRPPSRGRPALYVQVGRYDSDD